MSQAWKKCLLERLKSDSAYSLQQTVLYQCIHNTMQHNVATVFQDRSIVQQHIIVAAAIQIAITIDRDSIQLMSRNARILA